MTLTNYNWKETGEDEKGYFFLLSDTLHHCDYNVILIKDDGKVMVNGDYINNVPHELAAAIAPRIDYFQTLKGLKEKHYTKHHTKPVAKKAEKKTEPKKTEPKKAEPKKTEKKTEPKKVEKKEEKKSEKKSEKK